MRLHLAPVGLTGTKEFLCKKIKWLLQLLTPFSLLSFFFVPPHCQLHLSAMFFKNREKEGVRSLEKHHVDYSIQAKITKNQNYKKSYTAEEI